MIEGNPLGIGKEMNQSSDKKKKISPLSVGYRNDKDQDIPTKRKSNIEEKETEKDPIDLDSEIK